MVWITNWNIDYGKNGEMLPLILGGSLAETLSLRK